MNNSYDLQQRSKADGCGIPAEFLNNIFQHSIKILVTLYLLCTKEGYSTLLCK